MTTVEESIEVDVPIRTAYDQWTQFEEFPKFMDGVESVRQVDDTHLHWMAEIAGVRREWDAEITEQHPDERVAWRATAGADERRCGHLPPPRRRNNQGHAPARLRPRGVRRAGRRQARFRRAARPRGTWRSFKAFIESRGTESGRLAWAEVDRLPARETDAGVRAAAVTRS